MRARELYENAIGLDRVWLDHNFYGKETMGEYFERHNIPVDAKGMITLYHGRPKSEQFDVLRSGSYIIDNKESALHFAARDRELKPEEVEILTLYLSPDQIEPGGHMTLIGDYNLTNNLSEYKMRDTTQGKVYQNPSAKEVEKLLSDHKILRGIYSSGSSWVWNAYSSTHDFMEKALTDEGVNIEQFQDDRFDFVISKERDAGGEMPEWNNTREMGTDIWSQTYGEDFSDAMKNRTFSRMFPKSVSEELNNIAEGSPQSEAEAYAAQHGMEVSWEGSGDMGEAYVTDKDTIIKVTTDETEIAYAKLLVGKKLSNVADIYDVQGHIIYMENLDTTNAEDVYNDMSQYDNGDGVKYIDPDDHPDMSEEVIQMIQDLNNGIDELGKYGIQNLDIKGDNLGQKPNGDYAFFDMSDSKRGMW